MKAIVCTRYGSPEDLELRDVEKPTPQDNEVLVKVHATSINDWDWCLARGKPFYIRLLCGLRNPTVTIPGAEVAGTVEAVGQNVNKFQVGDAVYGDLSESGFGGFAEYVSVHENALALKPANMPFVEAATIPHAAMLAIQSLRDKGHMRSGQKLLINGAGGGVGTLGVQIAKYMGATEVTGVDSASKLDLMRSVGFDHVIDYKQEDFTKNGQRYDLILDTKTNRSPFDYTRVLSPHGTYVTVGGATSRIFQAFFLGPLIRRLSTNHIRVTDLKPNKDLDYANQLFEAGQIKPVVDGPYKLSEVPEAIRYFGEGKHTGKVVISLQDENAAN